MAGERRGFQRERDVLTFLMERGWVGARSASGPIDLIALTAGPLIWHPESGRVNELISNPPLALFVQVKSTIMPFGNFKPVERRRFLNWAGRAGADPWLAWWPSGGTLMWIPPDEWPPTPFGIDR